MPFKTKVDIGNRALQMVGATRITAFTDDSKNAAAISAVYDDMRVAELRRNVWRSATRRVVLTPLTEDSITVVPAAYDAAKTYIRGAIIQSDDITWIARDSVPITRTPADYPALWEQYFGALTAEPYDDERAYLPGELVYSPSTNAAIIYMSLVDANEEDPTAAAAAWSATVTYNKGDTVTYTAVVYQSTLDLNINHVPGVLGWEVIPATQPVKRKGQSWLQTNATFRKVEILWPMGTGPLSNNTTRNIFMLPCGFLREAPQNPKAGSTNWLGASGAAPYSDSVWEGEYFISSESKPIVFRFVADVADVSRMDPLFCNGLAARIALEVCEELTQSDTKLQNIGAQYSKFMGEARVINGIEVGPVEQAEDDFIACRR